jgi:hypothetical protein
MSASGCKSKAGWVCTTVCKGAFRDERQMPCWGRRVDSVHGPHSRPSPTCRGGCTRLPCCGGARRELGGREGEPQPPAHTSSFLLDLPVTFTRPAWAPPQHGRRGRDPGCPAQQSNSPRSPRPAPRPATPLLPGQAKRRSEGGSGELGGAWPGPEPRQLHAGHSTSLTLILTAVKWRNCVSLKPCRVMAAVREGWAQVW